MKKATSKDGHFTEIIPGEFRKLEVQVGRHIGPDSNEIAAFTPPFALILVAPI